MAKLIDQEGVAELVAKHVDNALRKQTADNVRAVKAITAEHVASRKEAGDKAAVAFISGHSKDVVSVLKGGLA